MADTKAHAAPKKQIVTVKLLEGIQFFNVAGTQLSANMPGIHLHWNGEVVVVTHDSWPGQEKWVFPGGISYIGWLNEV